MEKDKNGKSKEEKKESIGGLLATLERIDKKLNLFNTMNKTMPAMLLATAAILTAVVYVNRVAYIPDTQITLPQTGEDSTVTQEFIILYPEYRSTITLPDTLVGLALNGFYTDNTAIEFFVQSEQGVTTSLGIASKGSVEGEYFVKWNGAESGSYTLWAELLKPGETSIQSPTVGFNVK